MADDDKVDLSGYTTRQAADFLGLSKSTLLRYCDRGIVPFRRTPGGHRRFDERTLTELKGASR